MSMRQVYIAAAMAVAIVSYGRAETFTVNSTSDSAGSCVAGSQNCTLRAAIQAANSSGVASTIVVPTGTYLLSQATTCAIRTNGDPTVRPTAIVARCITGNLTIQGAGAGSTIIDAQQLDRVMVVTADGTAEISGVTLQHGSMNGSSSPTGASGGGGAINNQGSLTVSSCSLPSNSSQLDGGAIWSTGALTVIGCTISNNAALFNESGGGGIFAAYGTASIAYTTFHANASEALGGGVAAHAATASIVASTLDSNISGSGGGLYVDTQAKMTLTKLTISGNTGNNAGGGVNSLGTLIANNVTIAYNKSLNAVGGLIVSGQVTFGNSLVWGNTATNFIPDLDCLGDPVVSKGYNLIPSFSWCSFTGDQTGNLTGVDPLLTTLQDGGLTLTTSLNEPRSEPNTIVLGARQLRADAEIHTFAAPLPGRDA